MVSRAVTARRVRIKQVERLTADEERLAVRMFERAFHLMSRARVGLPNEITGRMRWRIGTELFDALRRNTVRMAGVAPLRELSAPNKGTYVLFGLPIVLVENPDPAPWGLSLEIAS